MYQAEQRVTATSRTTSPRIQTRASGGSSIVGYAAVFYREGVPGTEYALDQRGTMIERIAKGAFDRALSERHDVRGLFNHDKNFILGRTSSGTCRLTVDSIGLRYEIDANPEDPFTAHAISAIQRQDVSGSSFSMVPTRVRWEDHHKYSIRYIEDVDLSDVGPVTYPAYQASSSGIGGWAELERQKQQTDEVSVRLRMLELDEMAANV
ncbi:HK97 family phage prohead protease [Planctomycetaceae bacterium]|nr:HK97 family phage prohead protease [Planctomycetaceae bacterium]